MSSKHSPISRRRFLHAATIRMIYPEFAEKNRTLTYRAAYFFGRATREEIQDLYGQLKNGKE